MAYQSVFKRYELKYMLTSEQKQILLSAMNGYMSLDKYGRTTIRNLYFDTDSYRLIRRSIEKPMYKEKLRIRSYCRTSAETEVFVELKKKYDHVVYKRRLAMCERDASSWTARKAPCPKSCQISREIDYFLEYYGSLAPKVFLSYEREAFYSMCGDGLRVTFDENILARQTDLCLCSEPYGAPLLQDGQVLMEIKCSGGIPLWLVQTLSREGIYKTSYSKYGTAYRNIIYHNIGRIPAIQKEIISYGY